MKRKTLALIEPQDRRNDTSTRGHELISYYDSQVSIECLSNPIRDVI